ncbi:MAG: bifunctional proline dehydrogenase/L-glutamate gamma-semialdehyde dehydrogenase PutA [Gammaproteobacteria bacterium]|nr:bifunctional proline dehydrogenase/L-glutamate gamma-semialdehyde dehydrogenase PutA [Gammaproteobacteria bacterium]
MSSVAQKDLPEKQFFYDSNPLFNSSRAKMNEYYLRDETEVINELLPLAKLDAAGRDRVQKLAAQLVSSVRKNRGKAGGLDAFLQEYDLSSQEGIVLMCLAEALLRVPDAETQDKLIRDKLSSGDWRGHLGGSQSLFVNASTWGLMLTGQIVGPGEAAEKDVGRYVRDIVSRVGEPVVRTALRQAMRIMGHQFVMGRTIDEAIKRARKKDNRIYRYSFDMLGETALTRADAKRYFDSYYNAIDVIGKARDPEDSIFAAPSISVKLTALHPRFEFANAAEVAEEMTPILLALAEHARDKNIALTVDTEEAEVLDLTMEVIERVYRSDSLRDWEGFGLALQTYQKRAMPQVEWLLGLVREVGRRMNVRLVKGAYWDAEIKHAQVQGLQGYPLFTRKASSDVSFLACARRLLDARDLVYTQFATHNAHTLASIIEMAGDNRELEFQRLHGMGEELYSEVVGADKLNYPCRVYAPVGIHEDLLPYLVRRLLENGSNTSFVNRIVDEEAPVEEIIADPVAATEKEKFKPHPQIPLPVNIFPDRVNSRGINLEDPLEIMPLADAMNAAMSKELHVTPVINGERVSGRPLASTDPTDSQRVVGMVDEADEATVDRALAAAEAARPQWLRSDAAQRAAMLERAAALFEAHSGELLALLVREAGKTIPDAVSEVREAVDFLRYYALHARREFAVPRPLPGPTGESNELALQGRGIFVCISPWNFPLAIFTGQVAAALAAGNVVLAKPAEQTSLIGARAVALLHEAGIPGEALHFIPGPGSVIGAHAIADPRVSGVAFTGSTETARIINRTLANRDAPIAALVAETGGQNAMIVDSSALPEQVVLDVVQSSFNSAGQRCSALRVLFLQEEIADRVLELLTGYTAELRLGDPGLLRTDIGPVIDAGAQKMLSDHAAQITTQGKLVCQTEMPAEFPHGTFFAPRAVEIDSLSRLEDEVFGPVLHVIRYSANAIDKVIEAVNATGYGLTLGIHSRIDSSSRYIHNRIDVGNVYVNRNTIGAVVGVQPFGGCNLSGTGPKAGGPHYLHRFATERTLTINTSAVGGNTSLLSLGTG